jgi:hypothetical protein
MNELICDKNVTQIQNLLSTLEVYFHCIGILKNGAMMKTHWMAIRVKLFW